MICDSYSQVPLPYEDVQDTLFILENRISEAVAVFPPGLSAFFLLIKERFYSQKN